MRLVSPSRARPPAQAPAVVPSRIDASAPAGSAAAQLVTVLNSGTEALTYRAVSGGRRRSSHPALFVFTEGRTVGREPARSRRADGDAAGRLFRDADVATSMAGACGSACGARGRSRLRPARKPPRQRAGASGHRPGGPGAGRRRERLYSAGASRVYRYAPDTLAVDAVFGPPGASELAVSDGVLYVLVPSGTAGAVLRLDAQTGALLGSLPLRRPPGRRGGG